MRGGRSPVPLDALVRRHYALLTAFVIDDSENDIAQDAPIPRSIVDPVFKTVV